MQTTAPGATPGIAAAPDKIYEAFILRVSHPSLRGRNEDAMPGKTTTSQEPILELWRILALALIVAAGMLFVHVVVPADASADPVKAPTADQNPRP